MHACSKAVAAGVHKGCSEIVWRFDLQRQAIRVHPYVPIPAEGTLNTFRLLDSPTGFPVLEIHLGIKLMLDHYGVQEGRCGYPASSFVPPHCLKAPFRRRRAADWRVSDTC